MQGMDFEGHNYTLAHLQTSRQWKCRDIMKVKHWLVGNGPKWLPKVAKVCGVNNCQKKKKENKTKRKSRVAISNCSIRLSVQLISAMQAAKLGRGKIDSSRLQCALSKRWDPLLRGQAY